MKITDLPSYKRISMKFEEGEFRFGKVSELPIYIYQKGQKDMTPGHYVYAMNYGRIKFDDVPKKYRTRDFFLRALTGVSGKNDMLTYVKAHMGQEFDRDFFKDYIASNVWSLHFEENCFAYMPLDYIDEEMVSCAMLKGVDVRYTERRGDSEDWFYSVAKRKPEVLTQDFWTLGARLFAKTMHGKNQFLETTPLPYRTKEYYFAMCLENDTPVMTDFPEEVLTTAFLAALINDNAENIRSFSTETLERKVPVSWQSDELKFWQAAIHLKGKLIRDIPLNEERVEFFLEHYDKDSSEYRYGFKDKYKRWLKAKQESSKDKSCGKGNNDLKVAAEFTVMTAMAGIGLDNAVDVTSAIFQARMEHSKLLPIKFNGCVPAEFCKKYDQEEYLAEIYKKLGIEIVCEQDNNYYEVQLPQDLKIEPSSDSGWYHVKDSNDAVLLKYCGVGPFYDRTVEVQEIYVSL